jgi:hypothetical protein
LADRLRLGGQAAASAVGGAANARLLLGGLGLTAFALALGAAKSSLDEFAAVTTKAKEARRSLAEAESADDYRNAANLLRGTAAESFRANDGFGSRFTVGSRADRQGRGLTSIAEFAEAQAARLDIEQRAAAESYSTSVFGDDPAARGVDELTKGLEALAVNGSSAADQFNVLTRALEEMAAAAGDASANAGQVKINREQLSADVVGGLSSAEFTTNSGVTGSSIAERVTGILNTIRNAATGNFSLGTAGNPVPSVAPVISSEYTDIVNSRAPQIQQAILDTLPTSTPNGVIDDEVIVAAADAAVAALGVDAPEELQKQVRALVLTQLNKRKKAAADAAGEGPLSGKELNDVVSQVLLPQLQKELSALGPGARNDQKTAVLKRNLDLFQKQISRAGGDVTSETFVQYNILREQYAASAIEDINNLRRARQSRGAKNQMGLLRKAIQTAVKFGGPNDLAQLLITGGKVAAQVAKQTLEAQIEVLKAALAATPQGPGIAEDKKKQLRDLIALLEDLPNFEVGAENLYTTASDVSAANPKEPEKTETAAQRRAAARAAEAVRRGGSVAQARAAVSTAAADLAAAEKGTVAYYNALSSWYSAKNSLTDAILEYQNNKELLKIDLTNPVAEASAALNAARRKLASDSRKGKSPEVITADRLEVRRAEIAKEAAVFNKWLSDLQTNEQLKRITHAQYIQSLENEITRLKAIKKRTVQQQDQLNQAELALQAAKEALQGQFNLGDIKIPTPYEARRLATAQAGGGQYQAASNTTNTFYINGADTAQVESVIVRVLGPTASARSTTTTRRT